MIEDKRRDELVALFSKIDGYDEKEMKLFEVDLLQRYIKKLDKFDEVNRKEVNKLMMLLEYALQSAIERNEDFIKRFKALRVHAQKQFKMYHPGDLAQLGIGSGLAIGVGVGIAIGSGTNNIGIGIPIGFSIGIALGMSIGKSNEKKAKEEGRII